MEFLKVLCTYEVAAEQKARAVYDNILRLSDDPDVNQVIRFLREREVVHFQRFGEPNHTNSNRFLWQISGVRGSEPRLTTYTFIVLKNGTNVPFF